jgi:hypothetical protein
MMADMDVTIEVKAKAKEPAIIKRMNELNMIQSNAFAGKTKKIVFPALIN